MEDWSIGHLLRCTFLMERLVLLGLALMLACVVVTFIVVAGQLHSARRAQSTDLDHGRFRRKRRFLFAKLNIWIDALKSISVTAPYLGVAGTYLGLLDTYSIGGSGTWRSWMIWWALGEDAALLSTAAGLIVAILAIAIYNYLRSRLEALRSQIPKDSHHRGSHFHTAQSSRLGPRFSAIAIAPALALFVVSFANSGSFGPPTGFSVRIAPARCEIEGDRQIVLRVIDDPGRSPRLFINSEQTDWTTLESRLSMIYKLRARRVLYLFADDDVHFREVADAIDIVKNTRADVEHNDSEKLDISVRLVTPATMAARCP